MTTSSSGKSTIMPRVNPERIQSNLRAFARIGYGPNGMHRLAFSRADLRARQLLVHMMRGLGLATRVDEIGNVFGRRPRAGDDELPAVMVGSHLDTVPGGGRFDGSAGVVGALEVAAVLRDSGRSTRLPIELVSFACEESSRFGRGTIGSGVLAGAWDQQDLLGLRDARGITLSQVLQRLGLDPTKLDNARRSPGAMAAYFELHIEQGRVLEETGAQIGIVEAIAAPTRFRLYLSGQADHSGATPMSLRQDALTGAAEVILAVERRARSVVGVVGTVGIVRVEPGVMNVVPGQVELGIDVRSTVAECKRHVVELIRHDIDEIATSRGLSVRIDPLSDDEPVTLDPQLSALLEHCSRTRGLRSLRMPSGAGHDAMHLARLGRAGMVMVPSQRGISHDAAEWTNLDDLTHGIQVLADAVLSVAQADASLGSV